MSIPMSSPDLNDQDRKAVWDVINTPFLSMGPKVQKFEEAVRDFVGSKHAIAVNSGTAGLHTIIRAEDIRDGDLVITTPFSFVASTNAILFERAVPVFVDIDLRTGNMDVAQLKEAVVDLMAGGKRAAKWLPRKNSGNGKLKAIMPIDVFGQPADYDRILQIAQEYGLSVIEDSCEALGGSYKGRPAGTFGKYGVFAFYPNKQITTGEGGIVVTDDDGKADLIRALRNQGRAPGDTWLSHTYLGYNYRLDEMSAALGASQMTRIDELLNKREKVAQWYSRALEDIAGIRIPAILPETTRMSWFVYVIQLNEGIHRESLAKRLADRGVPVRPYFLPIHLQPYMIDLFDYRVGDYPLTEKLGGSGLALPFSGVMTESQVEQVGQCLREELAD